MMSELAGLTVASIKKMCQERKFNVIQPQLVVGSDNNKFLVLFGDKDYSMAESKDTKADKDYSMVNPVGTTVDKDCSMQQICKENVLIEIGKSKQERNIHAQIHCRKHRMELTSDSIPRVSRLVIESTPSLEVD